MSLSRLCRFASFGAVLALALLSLVPGSLRPHTGLPGPAEHFLAYFITGCLLAAQKRGAAYRIAVAVLLGLCSGIFELLQNFVPGRDPEILDFLVSFAGAICGVLAFAIADYFFRRRARVDAADSRVARTG